MSVMLNFYLFAYGSIFQKDLFESPWSIIQNIQMLFSYLINYRVNLPDKNIVWGQFAYTGFHDYVMFPEDV